MFNVLVKGNSPQEDMSPNTDHLIQIQDSRTTEEKMLARDHRERHISKLISIKKDLFLIIKKRM